MCIRDSVPGRVLAVRSAARFVRGGGVSTPARSRPTVIELANVSKIYRRYGARHFATLKSALMQRSILEDLKPGETFQALTDVSMSYTHLRAHETPEHLVCR